jgi:hypothetical protein
MNLIEALGNAKKALETKDGRATVKQKLFECDKIEAASTLDDLEEILDAAAEVGAGME